MAGGRDEFGWWGGGGDVVDCRFVLRLSLATGEG